MTQWVEESKRDTRWWIFHKQFLCRVSNIQSMSVEYLKMFGMPSSGDPYYDKQTANELIMRMLTIDDMVEFFRNGVSVYVCNVADTKEIYERITNHLMAWKHQLEHGFHTRGAPLDDLILLDRFAVAVYKHAKYQFTPDIVDSIMARRMSSILKTSRADILSAKAKTQVVNPETNEPEEDPYPERVSMADVFAGRKPTPPSRTGGPKWK